MARPLPPSLRSTSLAVDGLRPTSLRAPAPPRRPAVDVLRSPFRCDEKSSHQLVSELSDLRERRYGSTGDVMETVMTSDLKLEAPQIPSWSDLRQMLAEIRGSPSLPVEASLPHPKRDDPCWFRSINDPSERCCRFTGDTEKVVNQTRFDESEHPQCPSWEELRQMSVEIRGTPPLNARASKVDLPSPCVKASLPQAEQIPDQLDELIQQQQEIIREQRSMFLSNTVPKSDKRSQGQIRSSIVDSRPPLFVATTNLVPLLSTIPIPAPSVLDHANDRYSCCHQLEYILLGSEYSNMERASHLRSLADTQVQLMLDVRRSLKFKLRRGTIILQVPLLKDIPDSDQKPFLHFVSCITSLHMPRSCLMKFLKQPVSHFCNRVGRFCWICEIPPQPPPIASLQMLCCGAQLETETPFAVFELEISYLMQILCKISIHYSDELDSLTWVSDTPPQPPVLLQLQILLLSKRAGAFGVMNLILLNGIYSMTVTHVKLAFNGGMTMELKIVFIVTSSSVILSLASFKINNNVQKDRALLIGAPPIDILGAPTCCCDKLNQFFLANFMAIKSEHIMILTDISTHVVISIHGRTMLLWAMIFSFYSRALNKKTKVIIFFHIIARQVIVNTNYILYLTCYLKFLSETLVMCKSTKYLTFCADSNATDFEITLFRWVFELPPAPPPEYHRNMGN